MKPSIKNFHMTMHMALSSQHLLKQEGTIIWKDNPIDGNKIYVETVTPKRKNGEFGKSKICFYLEGDKTPEFETAKDFFEYYKVPPTPKRVKKQLVKIKPEALENRKNRI